MNDPSNVGNDGRKAVIILGESAHLPKARLSIVSLIVAGISYFASFVLPTYKFYVGPNYTVELGYMAFCMSFLSPFSDFSIGFPAFAGWLANPLVWFAVVFVLTGRAKVGVLVAIPALALSMFQWLALRELEARPFFLIGYYVWVFSILAVSVACVAEWRQDISDQYRRGFTVLK